MALKSQSCDEDIDEDGEEDEDRGKVVHRVQLGVFPRIVQIVLHCCHRVAHTQTQSGFRTYNNTVRVKDEIPMSMQFVMLY